MKAGRAILAGTTVVVAWVLPTAFLASSAAASKHSTKSPTCISGAKLSAATKATWPNAKVGPGLSPGQKICTYLSASSGETFLISHEALDGSTMNQLAKDSYAGDHFSSVSGVGKAALHGKGGFDVLLVQVGSTLYEFQDNSGAATVSELKAVTKLVLPG